MQEYVGIQQVNLPKTILVYSGLELIGDGFIKLPFLKALRGSWPQAKITWLAGKGPTVFSNLLAPLAAPFIDEIIENASIGLHKRELFGRRPLAGRHFDLVIDTQRGLPTMLILRRIKHTLFISAAWNYRFSTIKPHKHYKKPLSLRNQLLDLVHVASKNKLIFAPTPQLPQIYREVAEQILPKMTKPLLGLVPGAGGKHKCWPLDRYIALANWALSSNIRPAWLLGPQEQDLYLQLRVLTPEAIFPLQDTRFRTDPLFTMAVGERLSLAVTNDCGIAHMLAEAGCPLISLFGPTSAQKCTPNTSDLTLVSAQSFGSNSMTAIPLEKIITILNNRVW